MRKVVYSRQLQCKFYIIINFNFFLEYLSTGDKSNPELHWQSRNTAEYLAKRYLILKIYIFWTFLKLMRTTLIWIWICRLYFLLGNKLFHLKKTLIQHTRFILRDRYTWRQIQCLIICHWYNFQFILLLRLPFIPVLHCSVCSNELWGRS